MTILRTFILFCIICQSFAKTDSQEELDKLESRDARDFISTGQEALKLRIGPPITEQYYRGPNLIYDCKNRHFACVSDDNFQSCEEQLKSDARANVRIYGCVPIRSYLSQDKCFKDQMKAVHRVVDRSFCHTIPDQGDR